MGDLPSVTGVESIFSVGFLRGAASAAFLAGLSAASRPGDRLERAETRVTKRTTRLDFMNLRCGTLTLTRTGGSASEALETLDLEETGHAFVGVDAQDGLAEQRGDTEHRNRQPAGVDRHGIGGDQLVDEAGLESLIGDLVQHAVADGGADALGAMVFEDLGGGRERARGLGDVIKEEHIAARHLANDADRLD